MEGKKVKKIISFILIFTIIFSFSITGITEVVRHETVYVNLDHDGNTRNIKTVTHISGESKDEYYMDYGNLEDVRVLTEGVNPIIDNGTIKWDTKVLSEKDIYYEGKLEKKIPLELEIQYFIDGAKIEGKDLAGKSGDLEIKINVKNSKSLTTQIQVPLDLDIFTRIEAQKGVTSVVGKTMNVVFTHLPLRDESFTIKAEGKNIELNPILISSTSAKISLSGEFDEFADGIKVMHNGTKELEDGSTKLSKGMKALKDGLVSLSGGISKFYNGLKEIGNNLKTLVNGFSQFNLGLGTLNENISGVVKGVEEVNGGINKLNLESGNIETGISGLNDGIKEINGGLENLNRGLGEINNGHSNLVQLAQSLISSDDPRVKALAEGVINESKAIDELSQGLNQSKIGMDTIGENSEKLLYGYNEYNKGLNKLALGFNQLKNGIKELPQEINNMYLSHNQLIEGLTSLNQGFDAAINGGNEINVNAKKIPEDITEMVEGQEELADGLKELNDSGFKKIVEGLKNFTMDEAKDDNSYTSFIDEKNKENSSCQFIMQTPSIKMDHEKAKIETNDENNKTFIQRFLDLFSRFVGKK
jgi:putative membrane protein